MPAVCTCGLVSGVRGQEEVRELSAVDVAATTRRFVLKQLGSPALDSCQQRDKGHTERAPD